MIRFLLALYFKRRYGVRGGLKPPLGYAPWKRSTSMCGFWYRWRVMCWKVEDRLYLYSGLPARWDRWMRGMC